MNKTSTRADSDTDLTRRRSGLVQGYTLLSRHERVLKPAPPSRVQAVGE